MSKKPQAFDKVAEYDHLCSLISLPEKSKISETMNAIIAAQDYLQKIHDDAFKSGFDAGVDASEKTDKITDGN